MKNLVPFLIAFILCSVPASATSYRSIPADQISPTGSNTGVSIGASSSKSSALFDLESTSLGFLPPQMTTTQKAAISSPADGLIVYDTTLHQLQVYSSSASAWISAGGGGITYAADTGSANAYAIAPSPAATSYAAGNAYVFFAGNANTGASTLNVSSLGTKSILNPARRALAAGDIQANHMVAVAYDGTNFQLISEEAQAGLQVSASPMTTKGDLQIFSTVPARHGVPGDYGSVVPDSGATDGWRNETYLQRQHGRPGKNYIQYADFENNATTGWTAIGCASPVNGLPTCVASAGHVLDSTHGGTTKNGNTNAPAIDSSSAIGGTYAMNLGTTGAGAIGDGYVSSAYTIDPEDQGKVLTFRIPYKVASGTPVMAGTSANTYAVAFYDVVNNAFFGTAGAFNFVQSTGVGIATGTFQTASNTTQIQAFIYSPVAPTGTSSLLFDDVYVGPQTAPMGPAMSDMQSYTGSLKYGGSTATNVTSQTYSYSRHGDSINIRAEIIFNGAANASGTIQVPLPFTINSSKLVTAYSRLVGTGDMFQSSSSKAWGPALPFTDGGTNSGGNAYFVIASVNTTGINATWTGSTTGASNVPVGAAIANGDALELSVDNIPIQGFSSNTAMSSDTDTRVIAMRASKNSGTQSSTGAFQDVTSWDSINFDKSGSFNASTGVYTIPVSGSYRVSGVVGFTGNATGTRGAAVAVNGTIQFYSGFVPGVAGFGTGGAFSGIVSCSAGDSIKVQAFQSSGGNLTYDSSAAGITNLSIERLSGPAVVAATESVNFRAHGTSTSVTSSTPQVVFSTTDFDSHAGYSGGTYVFPVSGKYRFSTHIRTPSTAFTAGNLLEVYYNYNGGGNTALARQTCDNSNTFQMDVTASDLVQAVAGATLKIFCFSSATLTPDTATFAIERVGN